MEHFTQIGLPLWRQGVDSKVLKHRNEHEEYLAAKGFFKTVL